MICISAQLPCTSPELAGCFLLLDTHDQTKERPHTAILFVGQDKEDQIVPHATRTTSLSYYIIVTSASQISKYTENNADA